MPVELKDAGDTVMMYVIAVGAGVIGGLVAELLIARGTKKYTGVFELPGKRGTRLLDIGSFAAIPIGAVAAAVAITLFSFVQEVEEGGNTIRQYDVIRLIGLALVAGLASSGFLEISVERFKALVTQERFQTAFDATIKALDTLETKIGKSQDETKEAANSSKPIVMEAVREAANQTAPSLYDRLDSGGYLIGPNKIMLVSPQQRQGQTFPLPPPVDEQKLSQQAAQALDDVADAAVSVQQGLQAQVEIAREMIAGALSGEKEE